MGVLLCAGVVIAAGIYIPRRMGTHADPAQSNQGGASDVSGKAKTGDEPVSVTTPLGSVNVDEKGNVKVEAPGVSVNATPDGKVEVNAPGAGVKAGAKGSGKGQVGGTPAPAEPPGPSPEEIRKMEDMGDQLNVRAAAASKSVETLRQQQQAEGYNLRGDIAAAADRMQMYIAKGDAALKAKDLANAQKYYDLAEAEITKVEKFLGR